MKGNLLLGPLLRIVGGLETLKLVTEDMHVDSVADGMLATAYNAMHHEIAMRGQRDDMWKVVVRHNDAAGAVPYAMDQYGLTQAEAKTLINWYVKLCNSQARLLDVRPDTIDTVG